MNITSLARADQMIPMSKARASLPSLVKKLDDIDFFVLVKKYQPKAALVGVNFLSKLLDKYYQWTRQQDFAEWEKISQSIPPYPENEIETDIKHAIKAVRRSA